MVSCRFIEKALWGKDLRSAKTISRLRIYVNDCDLIAVFFFSAQIKEFQLIVIFVQRGFLEWLVLFAHERAERIYGDLTCVCFCFIDCRHEDMIGEGFS